MTDNKKIPAIYIRVSTDAQAEEGYSIEAQKEQLAAYCVSKGLKNYEFYIDGGWSGSNIDRPEIQRLISDAKAGKISHCIVYKLDRLSRSQKDTLYLIEDVFNPNDVDFVSLNESMDTSTPMGRLMLGILSAFAQLERENIRMRTRMGMLERVKSGLWMGGGRTPYAYDYDIVSGTLIPNEERKNKVRQARDLYVSGKSPQYIADVLGFSNDVIVAQTLKSIANCGLIEYNGVIYQGKHEPIFTMQEHEEVMNCVKARSVTRTATSKYLLTGLLECGGCGAKMRYQKWGKNGAKIICYSQQGKKYLVKDPNCNQEKVWASVIENEVLDLLFSLKAKEYTGDSQNSNIETYLILQEQCEDVKRKLKRLYSLYADDNNDVLLESINEQRCFLNKLEKMLEVEKNKKESSNMKNKSIEVLSTLEDVWDYMEIEEKQQAIRLIVNKVKVKDGHVSAIDLNI